MVTARTLHTTTVADLVHAFVACCAPFPVSLYTFSKKKNTVDIIYLESLQRLKKELKESEYWSLTIIKWLNNKMNENFALYLLDVLISNCSRKINIVFTPKWPKK